MWCRAGRSSIRRSLKQADHRLQPVTAQRACRRVCGRTDPFETSQIVPAALAMHVSTGLDGNPLRNFGAGPDSAVWLCMLERPPEFVLLFRPEDGRRARTVRPLIHERHGAKLT